MTNFSNTFKRGNLLLIDSLLFRLASYFEDHLVRSLWNYISFNITLQSELKFQWLGCDKNSITLSSFIIASIGFASY